MGSQGDFADQLIDHFARDVNGVAITVGITGTRKGCTADQMKQLDTLLVKLHQLYSDSGEVWLAHGDCIGVDAEAHQLAEGYSIRVHPPSNDKQRAWCTGANEVMPEQIYSVRNHDIVRSCDYLIVVPKEMHEVERSGTWSTVRFAGKMETPYTIILPDGRLGGEGWKAILNPKD